MARCLIVVGILSLLPFLAAAPSLAATPTVEQALKLKPVQADVEYDIPTGEDLKGCTISAGKVGGATGWIVRDATGHLLRTFVDTNGDNVVDQWCYFRNGVEVYRDIDSNFNGKADQYRWLHTAGMKFGLDRDENGSIDAWKAISAEEVTGEVVRALATKDNARFGRLLLSGDELTALGLGDAKAKELAARVAAAPPKFDQLQRSWAGRPESTKWLHFGAMQPGVVPAQKDEAEKDIVVYENVVALIELNGNPSQVWIGTMVQVGATWRLIDAPRTLAENEAPIASDNSFFFRAPPPKHPEPVTPQGGADEKMQKLLTDLEALDPKVSQAATDSEKAKLNQQRAEILEQLADASATPQDRAQWIRQMADTISAAAQAGHFQSGVERLKTLYDKEAARPDNKPLSAYIKFRHITAEYTIGLQAEKPDVAKLQEAWLANLKEYVKDYGDSPDTAEALLQLAIAEEFAGKEKEALEWYDRIVKDFAQAPAAAKARGAMTRLNSVGQVIQLAGPTLTGERADLSQFRGKVVVLHYWATWCEPCKADMQKIKEVYAQLGRNGFAPLGANLDAKKDEAVEFLNTNRFPWPHLHEPGSLDGRLANELGVLTLPTMLLIDKRGKVVNRNLSIAELETEVKKYLQQ
jgi:thiol-disulfide isomerase/thioredoxin